MAGLSGISEVRQPFAVNHRHLFWCARHLAQNGHKGCVRVCERFCEEIALYLCHAASSKDVGNIDRADVLRGIPRLTVAAACVVCVHMHLCARLFMCVFLC